jgi:hypothetical protein
MLTWLVDAGEESSALLAAGRKLDAETVKLSRKYAVVRMMLPSLSYLVTLHIRSIAFLRVAKVTVEAERFRIDRGALPTSLEELVPDYLDSVPIDPFDESPIRMKATEQGMIIYSIGDNIFDDGGEVATTPQNNRAPDVGLRLVRPELRTIVIVEPPPEDE